MPAPMTDATTALMLHAAWQPLRIGRPASRSTATAWLFIATSSVPCTAAKRDDGDDKHQHAFAQSGRNEHERHQEEAEPDDPRRADAGDHRADELHGDQSGGAEEHADQTELAVVEVLARLQRRYPDEITAQQNPVEKEHRRHRPPTRNGGR